MIQEIDSYLEKVTPERPAVLREMEQYASDNNFPIVGPLVGRILYQLVLVTKARTILEMGCGYGYSAFWMSLAAKGRGKITMIDLDRTNKKRAFDFFKRAGLQSQFDFKVGRALPLVKKIDGPFDIIFNDINKDEYPDTIDIAAKKLKKGGLFITDNIIWSGKVVHKKPDKTTRSIMAFTNQLYADSRFFTTVLPVRDGISLSIRL